ncbi:MAG: penicillin acylase family protein, partial [Bryobacteraceae bacterium]
PDGESRIAGLSHIFIPRCGSPPWGIHKVIPEGYRPQLAYEWAAPFRYLRIEEMIEAQKKFSIQDFIRMQQDVVSVPARRLQAAARKSLSTEEAASHPLLQRLLAWDAALTVDSVEASLYSVWTTKLQDHFAERGFRPGLDVILVLLEANSHKDALLSTFQATLEDLRQRLGEDSSKWNWGRIHTLHLRHPIDRSEWHRGPVARPGDGNTVNSTSGANYRQTNGASYRQILDLSDWDRSVMTNVPGESGDPASPHYSDLMETWARGEYHPMPYSRKAVEAATVERIDLKPAR